MLLNLLLKQIEDRKVTRLVPNDGYDLSMKGDYLNRGNRDFVILLLLNQMEKVTRFVPNDGYDLSLRGTI